MEKYDDHDPAYAAIRNKFIPKAEAYANMVYKKMPKSASLKDREEWYAKWTKAYLSKVEELYQEYVRTHCLACGRKL